MCRVCAGYGPKVLQFAPPVSFDLCSGLACDQGTTILGGALPTVPTRKVSLKPTTIFRLKRFRT